MDLTSEDMELPRHDAIRTNETEESYTELTCFALLTISDHKTVEIGPKFVVGTERHYGYVYTSATPSVKYPVPKVPPLKPGGLAMRPATNTYLGYAPTTIYLSPCDSVAS